MARKARRATGCSTCPSLMLSHRTPRAPHSITPRVRSPLYVAERRARRMPLATCSASATLMAAEYQHAITLRWKVRQVCAAYLLPPESKLYQGSAARKSLLHRIFICFKETTCPLHRQAKPLQRELKLLRHEHTRP